MKKWTPKLEETFLLAVVDEVLGNLGAVGVAALNDLGDARDRLKGGTRSMEIRRRWRKALGSDKCKCRQS